jgi:hypothetical protein
MFFLMLETSRQGFPSLWFRCEDESPLKTRAGDKVLFFFLFKKPSHPVVFFLNLAL